MKPTDLRGILKYVPQFRDHIFVIAIDGSIIDDDNFQNVLTDLAVLRSLNIKIILVHGIGRQIKQIAEQTGTTITDAYGGGPTDEATLKLAITASTQVSYRIIEGLTRNGLKYATTNAVRATVMGILHGVDHQSTGRLERVDLDLVRTLLQEEIVPLFSPIVFDREGRALRINSDLLAAELAVRLGASKLIYLTPHPGLLIDEQMVMNLPLSLLEQTLTERPASIDERTRSKARYATFALQGGTSRAHILDGRVYGCLLTEIFDKVGLGTMVHADEYQQIRPARRKDATAISTLLRNASKSDAVRQLSFKQVEKQIDSFFVYEIDDSIIGCVRLIHYRQPPAIEIASLYVQPFYQGRGVGRKLVEFCEREAKKRQARQLFALSTQNFVFFKNTGLFEEGSLDDLPQTRRDEYVQSGRHSRILIRYFR